MTEKVLMKGNEAMAEAAMRAGCRFFFGYPITPQTELAAYMARQMPKRDGVYLQAESEVAAINMVYGASAAGARAMTSSSTFSAEAPDWVPFSPRKVTISKPRALWDMAISTCRSMRRPLCRRWPIWSMKPLMWLTNTERPSSSLPMECSDR